MTDLSDVFRVYSPQRQVVANIVLNGYNIEAGGPLGRAGMMRSFMVVKGDLWDAWNTQSPLIIRHEDGREVSIRVAALPVEDDSFGLIEFI